MESESRSDQVDRSVTESEIMAGDKDKDSKGNLKGFVSYESDDDSS